NRFTVVSLNLDDFVGLRVANHVRHSAPGILASRAIERGSPHAEVPYVGDLLSLGNEPIDEVSDRGPLDLSRAFDEDGLVRAQALLRRWLRPGRRGLGSVVVHVRSHVRSWASPGPRKRNSQEPRLPAAHGGNLPETITTCRRSRRAEPRTRAAPRATGPRRSR